MSIGLILLILLVIFLLGGFSGRFGGYGYGYGHGGIGVIGVIAIVVVVLLLTGRLEDLCDRELVAIIRGALSRSSTRKESQRQEQMKGITGT